MRLMFEEVRKNKIMSFFLFVLFFALVGLLGVFFGYMLGNVYVGIFITVFFGAIYSMIAYFSGDRMILSMSGAKPVTKQEYPYLYHTIEGLAIAAGLKTTPKAYVIEDSAMNAFATGRDPEHSSITVTTGLLKAMNRQELEGVIAHEMSHIKNYDIRIMMLAAVLVGIVTLISDIMLRSFLWSDRRDRENNAGVIIIIGLLLAVLSPIIAQLIKLAISRKREFTADANAAILTRYPKGLADALRKIANDPDPLVDRANKATAHLFISTPFRKKKGFFVRMFSTHPPIEERIKRLEEM